MTNFRRKMMIAENLDRAGADCNSHGQMDKSEMCVAEEWGSAESNDDGSFIIRLATIDR
jgi:hypothetical protein